MSQRDHFNSNPTTSSNNNKASSHNFLQAERTYELHSRRNERDNANANETMHVQSDFRVMRCFCGCSTLTFEQIEHFAMMNIASLIVHPEGKPLFKNFLRVGHRNDKSEAMEFLECFEICEKLLKHLNLIHDDDQLDELFAVCPSFTWEERITEAVKKDKKHHLNSHVETIHVLNELKRNCIHNIECHRDFGRFHMELLRKINK